MARSTVSDSATSVTIVAANTARLGLRVYNESTERLYLSWNSTATVANSFARLEAYTEYEFDADVDTAALYGIWAANGSGRAIVFEEIGRASGGTWTQTYSTANRTVAAPTAAAVVTLTDSTGQSGTHDDTLAATTVPAVLTLSDGEGTNDSAIPAITDNASTITAVQELAAKVNALIALITVMAQNQSDVAQKVIELVAEHTKIVADDLDNRQSITALVDDLQGVGDAA
jgi:hypothetical protein